MLVVFQDYSLINAQNNYQENSYLNNLKDSNNNKKNENKIIEKYLPLVKSIVNQLSSQVEAIINLDDMLQIGLISLLESCRRYGNIDENFQFFAKKRIRGSILDELRKLDWRPRDIRQNSHKINNSIKDLRKQLNRDPNAKEIQDFLNITEEDYKEWEKSQFAENLISLDELLNDGQDIENEEDNPAKIILNKNLLINGLNKLNEKEKKVIQLYYEYEFNLKEIALILELTEARVCQINKSALNKLKIALSD